MIVCCRVAPRRKRSGARQYGSETIGIGSLKSPTVRSPDFTGVGPGNAPIVSPDIFCKSRTLMCVMHFTYTSPLNSARTTFPTILSD